MSKRKRHPDTGIQEPSSPAELAKSEARQITSRPRVGFRSGIDADPRCKEYIDAVMVERKAGRSQMTVRQMHEKLVQHFGYQLSEQTVGDYIRRTHGGLNG